MLEIPNSHQHHTPDGGEVIVFGAELLCCVKLTNTGALCGFILPPARTHTHTHTRQESKISLVWVQILNHHGNFPLAAADCLCVCERRSKDSSVIVGAGPGRSEDGEHVVWMAHL